MTKWKDYGAVKGSLKRSPNKPKAAFSYLFVLCLLNCHCHFYVVLCANLGEESCEGFKGWPHREGMASVLANTAAISSPPQPKGLRAFGAPKAGQLKWSTWTSQRTVKKPRSVLSDQPMALTAFFWYKHQGRAPYTRT